MNHPKQRETITCVAREMLNALEMEGGGLEADFIRWRRVVDIAEQSEPISLALEVARKRLAIELGIAKRAIVLAHSWLSNHESPGGATKQLSLAMKELKLEE